METTWLDLVLCLLPFHETGECDVLIRMMKILSACIALTSIPHSLLAKEPTNPEPEYEGVFFEVNNKTGVFMEMPRETPHEEAKAKAFGFGGAKVALVWPGTRCSYRIAGRFRPSFVVRVASRRIDPRDVIQFYKVETEQSKRSLVLAKAKGFGGVKTTMDSAAVGFDSRPHGASSVIFQPTMPLTPGEYVLSTTATSSSSCFGIDP